MKFVLDDLEILMDAKKIKDYVEKMKSLPMSFDSTVLPKESYLKRLTGNEFEK